jgi:DNA-binding response OmpR family regulator
MRVIVVEDNVLFCNYICNFLQKADLDTVRTYRLAQAKKVIGTSVREDDIVLADLRLPDGESTTLLQWMRENGYMHPFIMMTNYEEIHSAVHTMKLGAEDYILKPLVETRLLPRAGSHQPFINTDNALPCGFQLAAEQQLELLQELQGLIQDRYQAEINAVLELTQNAQRLRDAARSIRDYVQSLKTGELSPYTMGERLAESASQFFITVAQAKSGDETALGQVQEKASTYLQLGQDYYGSNEGYSGPSGIFANVLATLEGLGLGLDGMSAGQDAAALAAQAQARYSQQAIAEMQRLRAGFVGVENVLQNQLVAQTSAAAQILARMTGPEQLAALRALPAEIAALIRGQAALSVVQVGSGSAGDARSVVEGWYRDDLSRSADSEGLSVWTSVVNSGDPAAHDKFMIGARAEKQINAAYSEVLGRQGDAAGVRAYQDAMLRDGWTIERVRQSMLASDEYRARNLPQFAVGAERLPGDMIAQLHKGEGIIPAWANTRMLDAVERGAGMVDQPPAGAELAQLRADVQLLTAVTEQQAAMIERLLSALGRAVIDSSVDNAGRVVDGVAAATQINNWRAGARPVLA